MLLQSTCCVCTRVLPATEACPSVGTSRQSRRRHTCAAGCRMFQVLSDCFLRPWQRCKVVHGGRSRARECLHHALQATTPVQATGAPTHRVCSDATRASPYPTDQLMNYCLWRRHALATRAHETAGQIERHGAASARCLACAAWPRTGHAAIQLIVRRTNKRKQSCTSLRERAAKSAVWRTQRRCTRNWALSDFALTRCRK